MASQLSVWAAGGASPTLVCGDARLRDADVDSNGRRTPKVFETFTSKPVVWGQAGWHIGINFGDLPSLIQKLRSIEIPEWAEEIAGLRKGTQKDSECGPISIFGRIHRLAINCHGFPGVFAINGNKGPDLTFTSATTEPTRSLIFSMGQSTIASESTLIYLMG